MAIPLGYLAGSLAAQAIGGILGMSAADEANAEAQALLKAAWDRVEALKIPDLAAKNLIFQQFVATGDFTPESLSKTIEEYEPTFLVKENPLNRLRQEEMYGRILQASKTGLSAQDQLSLEQIRRKAEQDALSRMATLSSQAKREGRYGAGQDLAARMMEAQGAADRQSMENLQIAANAQQNQLAQEKALYDMASGIRATDLDVLKANQMARAQNQEMRTKYSTARQLQNKSWAEEQKRRYADLLNQVSQQNVKTSQAETLRKGYTAPLEMAKLQFEKEKMLADIASGRASAVASTGAAKAQGWGNIASGVGQSVLGFSQLE